MYIDFNVPWTVRIDYKIDYSRSITKDLDTNYITQSIGLRGDLSITKNWKISYMTNYDFIRKGFSFTSINIARDLHCWQMSFNWIPFGFMRELQYQYKFKSALLQDLKRVEELGTITISLNYEKSINIKNAPDPVGPYSQAIIHNNIMYASESNNIDPKKGVDC